MEHKPWCILVLAALILVFTFWTTAASFWIVWIAAALIVIKSLVVLHSGCKCCDVKPVEKPVVKKKVVKKK
jgi:hypothetical protein